MRAKVHVAVLIAVLVGLVFLFSPLFSANEVAFSQDSATAGAEKSKDAGGDNEPVYKVGHGVSPPRVTYQTDPEYSKQARKAKYQGTCVLSLIVGKDGKPRNIRVDRGLDYGLSEKAVEAVEKWTFEPAEKDGKPVAVMINVEVTFRLY